MKSRKNDNISRREITHQTFNRNPLNLIIAQFRDKSLYKGVKRTFFYFLSLFFFVGSNSRWLGLTQMHCCLSLGLGLSRFFSSRFFFCLIVFSPFIHSKLQNNEKLRRVIGLLLEIILLSLSFLGIKDIKPFLMKEGSRPLFRLS